MNKEENEFEKKVSELRDQWLFVVVGAFLAIFVGIAVNAAYDILKVYYSTWYIFAFGSIFSLLIFDVFSHLLTTAHHMRDHPEETSFGFLKRYWDMRLRSFQF